MTVIPEIPVTGFPILANPSFENLRKPEFCTLLTETH